MLDGTRGWFGVLAVAALGAASSGCASGEHDQTFHFLVEPVPGATEFAGWTEIKLGIDINSVGAAELWGVTLGMQDPPPVPDLTFLETLVGQADTGSARTTLVTCDSFPAGDASVQLNVVYLGDLHPMFKDANTIRIDWTGAINTSYKQWPTGGIWMQGDVVINIP